MGHRDADQIALSSGPDAGIALFERGDNIRYPAPYCPSPPGYPILLDLADDLFDAVGRYHRSGFQPWNAFGVIG